MSEAIAFIAGTIAMMALWLWTDIKDNPYTKGYGDGYRNGYRNALLNQKQWTPCSEGLPEPGVDVNVTLKDFDGDTYVVSGWLSQDKDYWVADDSNWDTNLSFGVLAWMPCPEPYREDANEAQNDG